MTNKKHIEKVIKDTFEIIKQVYANQQEKDGLKGPENGSRIIFPKKRKNGNKKEETFETRVSEQELRFIFVEQLNKEIGEEGKNWDVYYSVETSTLDSYYFKGENPDRKDGGQSANFDLVIHGSNFKRIALIEFKANNLVEHEYKKDFAKLNNEKEGDELLRYFIEIVKTSKKYTYKNIHGKIKRFESIFRCYSLDGDNEITYDFCLAPLELY